MKKISIVACTIVLLIASVIISGCSCNQKILDFNYKYSKCLIYERGVWVEYQVKAWDDYDDGTVTVWTTDGQMIFTHTQNVILYGQG